MPSMGLQRAPIQKFKGLNTRDAPYDLDAGESPDCIDVRPLDSTDDESILQRLGKLNRTGSGSTNPALAFYDGFPLAPNPAIGATNARLIMLGEHDIFYLDMSSAPTLGDPTSILNSAVTGESWCGIQTVQTSVPTAWFLPNAPGGTAPQKYTTVGGMVAWGAVPPTWGDQMVYWRGRVVVIQGNSSRVLYSDVGNPEAPAAGYNFIDIFDSLGSTNVGLLVHNNNLYLLKGASVWMIYDPNTFANRIISSHGAPACNVACSNPSNRRMYWLSSRDRHIHSSNGETDDIVETWKVPTEMALVPTTLKSRSPNGLGMAFDPQSKSVMFGYSTTSSTSTFNRVLEITVAGKPGDHPIYRHAFTGQCFIEVPQKPSSGSQNWQRLMIPNTAAPLRNVYEMFSQVGSDDGVAIDSKFTGAWAPFISEEPMERIRRVNFLYRGLPVIDISSVPAPSAAPPVFTLSPAEFAGASSTDRTYLSLRGPNKKGRYHQFTVRNNVLGKDFALSALEFVIRGGKEKK